MTLVRDDGLGFVLEPGCHSYRVKVGERTMGAVVSASSSRGRLWWAYRPHPSRVRRWVVAATASTRHEAARAIGGRP